MGGPKFRTALALSGIKPEALASVPFWLQCMVVQRAPDQRHGPSHWYTAILPSVTGGYTIRAAAEAAEARGLHGEPSVPQRSGTCYFRCALASVKHILQRRGVSASQPGSA